MRSNKKIRLSDTTPPNTILPVNSDSTNAAKIIFIKKRFRSSFPYLPCMNWLNLSLIDFSFFDICSIMDITFKYNGNYTQTYAE